MASEDVLPTGSKNSVAIGDHALLEGGTRINAMRSPAIFLAVLPPLMFSFLLQDYTPTLNRPVGTESRIFHGAIPV
jgi:hypothetical protein